MLQNQLTIEPEIPPKTLTPIGQGRDLCRSEGFPLTGYFVPGRDGVGVGQDSRILPAPSLTNIRWFMIEMTNLGSRLEYYRISCGGCDQYKGILFMMMVRNENKHICSFLFLLKMANRSSPLTCSLIVACYLHDKVRTSVPGTAGF